MSIGTGSLAVSLQNSSPMPLAAEFDCSPGELVALVGPSGSGKTSVLRAVAGLLPAAHLRGRISVGPQHWLDSDQGICLAPQQRRVGLVFQSYALFPHLCAQDNVALAADATWSAADLDVLLQRLGLAGLARRRPSQLSGGQQQRVALARALVRLGPPQALLEQSLPLLSVPVPVHAQAPTPSVLLLDEPFSAVDAPTRHTLYRELAAQRTRLAVPMVLVTHDLHEARRLADRVVILDGGTSLQSGSPQQVFASPRNARVAELVGIQNHFSGRFEQHEPGWGVLHWGGLQGAQSAPGRVQLRVVDKNKIAHGAAVTWVVAGELLDLQPEPAPAGVTGAAGAPALPPNTVRCQITEALGLGEISLCTLEPEALAGERITLSLSGAALRAMQIEKGAWVRLAIPPHSVHIMPLR